MDFALQRISREVDMSNADVESGYRGDYAGRGVSGVYGSGRTRQGRGIFISTEARPGFITSEFWLTLIGVATLVVLAYASDALGVRFGLGMATVILLGYILSRGIAKAGSGEVVSTEDR
jgi:hypothetical protein